MDACTAVWAGGCTHHLALLVCCRHLGGKVLQSSVLGFQKLGFVDRVLNSCQLRSLLSLSGEFEVARGMLIVTRERSGDGLGWKFEREAEGAWMLQPQPIKSSHRASRRATACPPPSSSSRSPAGRWFPTRTTQIRGAKIDLVFRNSLYIDKSPSTAYRQHRHHGRSISIVNNQAIQLTR
jgi:hypothetical protein